MPDRRTQTRNATGAHHRSGTPAVPAEALDTKNVDTSIPRLPILMNVEETAAALGLCAASVRTAIEKGDIPAQIVNGRWRVVTAQLMGRWHQAEAARIHRLKRGSRALKSS